MLKKTKILVFLTGMVIVLFFTVDARNASSNVVGGKHDLSSSGNSNFQFSGATPDDDQPCLFCHTPHGANTTQTYDTNPNTVGASGNLFGSFLWNRALPKRTWTPYTSTTMNHNTSNGPGILSLLCLSCHDGVGAMNVLINYTAGGQPVNMGSYDQFGDSSTFARENIGEGACAGGGPNCATGGGELQNDHPIGFVYDDTLDTGLNPIAGMSQAVRDRMMRITNGRMECSSCHDPHMTNPGGNNFLVMSNTGSQLCLQCHKK